LIGLIAPRVVDKLLRRTVRATVNFDDQLLSTARKIYDEVLNRKLPHEFESSETTIS
jgi:hypothetical protein